MQRLELPSVCPQSSACSCARIAIAEPLALAVALLPVADLDLAAWTRTTRCYLQRCNLAIRVHANAIIVHGDDLGVVWIASTISMIFGLDAETTNTDAHPEFSSNYGRMYKVYNKIKLYYQ